MSSKTPSLICLLAVFALVTSCAMVPQIPDPSAVVYPEPRWDSEGKYISPFTSDDVIAGWVEKGMNAKLGAAIGSYAGQKAMENVPFVGGFLGDTVGSKMGTAAAIEMSGGMDNMRETTDLSFDEVEGMILYTYARHSDHPDYQKVMELVGAIYPDFTSKYARTIQNAPTKPADLD